MHLSYSLSHVICLSPRCKEAVVDKLVIIHALLILLELLAHNCLLEVSLSNSVPLCLFFKELHEFDALFDRVNLLIQSWKRFI